MTLSQNLKCIIFDWDGTLVTAEPMVHAAYVATFKDLGDDRVWMPENTHAQNGKNPNDIFADKTLWGNRGMKAKTLFYANFHRLKTERPGLLSVKEGATELLESIKVARPDIKIVILAAKTQSILMEEVVKKGFISYVHAVIGSTAEGPNKPDPTIFKRIENTLGFQLKNRAEEILHIGDNLIVDTQFAESLGVQSVVVNEKGSIKNLQQLLKNWQTVQNAKPAQIQESKSHTRQ